MDLQTFERRALELWASIPERFRDGVTAFIVEPGTYDMGRTADDFALGLCESDEVMAQIPGAPLCSQIRIFYGTFVDAAADDPDWDWEEELWETIRHELQHHLEHRAGVDPLGDEDEVEVQNQLRIDGEDFTPFFHRGGVPLDRGVFLAGGDLFIEVKLKKQAWFSLAEHGVEHRWGGLVATVPPVEMSVLKETDLLYSVAEVGQLETSEETMPWYEVVLVLERVRGWFG